MKLDDHKLAALLTGLEPVETQNRYKNLAAQFPVIFSELQRTGVNRWVVWNEYKSRYPDGYQYSQFCHHLNVWEKHKQVTLHLEQQPADKRYIDYTGKPLHWVDRSTGEVHPAEVFVAVLGYSQMTYVEACSSQSQGVVSLKPWIMLCIIWEEFPTLLCQTT